MAEDNEKDKQQTAGASNDVISQIAEKIGAAESVLIALSKDPTLDELAAAIGFCAIIDKLGKHGTAIFSGKIPAALDFLDPAETLEKDTSSLQDFIIALSKDKADHLRYKVEGDFVKIFITPYKTSLSEKDLEYSHGDYNVDLVIALDVADAGQLDESLSEYGRILHNATTVNITTEVPGKFADIEWANPAASSVSEMLVELTGRLGDKLIDKEEATALLAGIIAATDGFKSKKATAETFMRSSELINAGADQAVIAENITKQDVPETASTIDESGSMQVNQDYEEPAAPELPEEPEDPTQLSIPRDPTPREPKPPVIDEASIKPFAESVVDEPSGPLAKDDSAQQLDEMMAAEKAKYDVPGPMAAELAASTAASAPDANTDYARQMENELNEWVGEEPKQEETPAPEALTTEPEQPVEQPAEQSQMPQWWPQQGGETPAEAPVAQSADQPEPQEERDFVEADDGRDDKDSYVIDKPQTVLQPIGMGIPPVAPLSVVASALEQAHMEEPAAQPAAFDSVQPAAADGEFLPPPPPPPVPDASAFQLPQM